LDESVGIDPNPGLPVVVGDTIFVSSNGFAGAFTVALEALTGQERWKTSTGDFSAGAPALFDGALLVGSDTGDLIALDPATGVELWRTAVPNKIDVDLNQATPPLFSNGMIFVVDNLGGVIGLNAAGA
jgi:outer membrane protein assembly factor BamB